VRIHLLYFSHFGLCLCDVGIGLYAYEYVCVGFTKLYAYPTLSLSAAVLLPARERRRCDELDCAMLDLFMFIFI